MPEQVNGTIGLPPPLLDPNCVLNACNRTLDTAAATAGIALDAARKVSQRQFDVAQQTAAAFASSVRNLGQAASPADAIGGQAESLRASWEHAFAGTREVVTILQQSGGATLALLGKRMAEAMNGIAPTAGAA